MARAGLGGLWGSAGRCRSLGKEGGRGRRSMVDAVVMAKEETKMDTGMGTYVVISRRGRQETEDQPEGTQDAGAGGGLTCN